MHELAAGELGRLRALVPPHHRAGHMAFVHAIIDGLQPGTVFVDDVAAPRSALAFNHSGFAFALGQPRADLVAPMWPELGLQPWLTAERTSLWCTEPGWQSALRPLFGEPQSRDEFHFDWRRAPVAAPMPYGYRLAPLDAELAARWGEGLDPWVVRIWGGAARFAARAFGTGVLFGDALVAICTVCAVAGHPGAVEAEIEIGTDPQHRRQGLAVAAAVAFFEQCRERDVLPAWTCASSNLASQLAAARLGFRKFRKVAGFRMAADALG
jgi:RimJ/RimL family protein N-acetyltransferase